MYYLQDSGGNYWQLGVSILGQLTTTPVGAETVVPLVLYNNALGGAYWKLGVTTLGQITTTNVSPTTATSIQLQDSNGNYWAVQVTYFGSLTTTSLSALSDNQDVLIFEQQLTGGT